MNTIKQNIVESITAFQKNEEKRLEMISEQIKKGCSTCSEWNGSCCNKCELTSRL